MRKTLIAAVAVVGTLTSCAPTEAPKQVTKPEPIQFVSRPAPPEPKPAPKPKPTVKPAHTYKPTTSKAPSYKPKPAPKPSAIVISSYVNCGWDGYQAQRCIDKGLLTRYLDKVLAGHNYMGWQWLSRVPVGKTVRVTSGPLAGTYRVYGHMRLGRQSGYAPSFAGADLVLQACEGSGTGFSLAKRVG